MNKRFPCGRNFIGIPSKANRSWFARDFAYRYDSIKAAILDNTDTIDSENSFHYGQDLIIRYWSNGPECYATLNPGIYDVIDTQHVTKNRLDDLVHICIVEIKTD